MSISAPYLVIKEINDLIHGFGNPPDIQWSMVTQKEDWFVDGQWKGSYVHRGFQLRWKRTTDYPYPSATLRRRYGSAWHYITHERRYKTTTAYRYAAWYGDRLSLEHGVWKVECCCFDDMRVCLHVWHNDMRDPLDERGPEIAPVLSAEAITMSLHGHGLR